MSHPDPRSPAADGERDLPEEIVKAIETFEREVRWFEEYGECRDLSVQSSRVALTTSILSRLTAAEAGREEAEARVEKLEKALAPFVAHADRYADWLRKAIAPNPSNEAFEAARSALIEAQPKGDQ